MHRVTPPNPLPRLLVGALLFICAWSGTAMADISRDEAAQRAQRQTGGRVLAVERQEHDGHAVYRIKVLLGNGDVRVLEINARNGNQH